MMKLFQDHDENAFAYWFGTIIKEVVRVKVPFHVLSFCTGFIAFFLIFYSAAAEANLLEHSLLGGLVRIGVIILAVLAASVVERMHFVVPDLMFRMICQPKTIISGVPSLVMFVVLSGLTYGITRVSQITSSSGAGMSAKYLHSPPPPTDITGETAQYKADSATIALASSMKVESAEMAFAAEKNRVVATYDSRISTLRGYLASHRLDKKNGNTWADGWIKRREGEIAQVKVEKASALAQAESDHQRAMASILAENGEQIAVLSTGFRGFREKIRKDDDDAAAAAQGANDQLVSWAQAGGVNLVYLILVLSFLKVFYQVHSGHKFKGLVFRPGGRLSRAWAIVNSIVADKFDHQVDRLDVTRTHFKERGEVRPYALPSGRTALVASLGLLLVYFAAVSLPYGGDGTAIMSHLQILPESWNSAGLAVTALALIVANWKHAGRATQEKAPVPPRKKKTPEADNLRGRIIRQIDLLANGRKYIEDPKMIARIDNQISLLENAMKYA